MADEKYTLASDEQPERGKLTLQHIKDTIEQIMRSAPKEKTERKIKFATGCDYRGLMWRNSEYPFIETCGNSDCSGCNKFLENINRAFREEVEKWQFQLDERGMFNFDDLKFEQRKKNDGD